MVAPGEDLKEPGVMTGGDTDGTELARVLPFVGDVKAGTAGATSGLAQQHEDLGVGLQVMDRDRLNRAEIAADAAPAAGVRARSIGLGCDADRLMGTEPGG
jgi:hypothetical protein